MVSLQQLAFFPSCHVVLLAIARVQEHCCHLCRQIVDHYCRNSEELASKFWHILQHFFRLDEQLVCKDGGNALEPMLYGKRSIVDLRRGFPHNIERLSKWFRGILCSYHHDHGV